MDFLLNSLSGVASTVLSRPEVQVVLTGVVIKVVTDRLKPLLKQVDESGEVENYKVPLQLVVIVSTFVATTATMALKKELGNLNVEEILNFIATGLPVYISAMGAKKTGDVIMNQVKKAEDSK